MRTHYRYFIPCILLFAFCLAGCQTRATPSAVAPQPTPTPAPHDGSWSGSGVAADGRVVTIRFTIRGDKIINASFGYKGIQGIFCTSIAYDVIPVEQQPTLTDEAFSAKLGEDFTLSGKIESDATASGQAHIDWKGRPNCDATLDISWTGTKQQEIQKTTVANNKVGVCGPANCRDVIIQILIFGLLNGAILALNAIGITLIYSTVRTLNLAHGDVFALTTALVTSTINAFGVQRNWPPLQLAVTLILVLLAAAGFGALLSLFVERAAFKPFRGRSRLAPVIASLGLSFILFQGALVWRTFQHSWIPGEHRSVPGLPEVPTDGIPDLLPQIDLVKAAGINAHIVFRASDLIILVVAIIFVLATTWLIQRTDTGRMLRASAQNPMLAEIVGVNLDGAIRRAFAIGGGLAGAAAFIFALYYARPFGAHGAQSGLFAFTAALLGGIGSPIGALISGLLLGIVGSFSDYFISGQWTPVVLLGLLLILLVIRPGGLIALDNDELSESMRDAIMLSAPSQSQHERRWVWIMLAALALFPLISLVFNLGGLILLKGVGIFIILALGLNILLGLAGVLDLGFTMSFGLGGYLAAIITDPSNPLGKWFPQPLNFIVVALLCMVVAGAFGALKGGIARRLRGDYLAIATLTLGLLAQRIIVNLRELTGGSSGIGAIPPPSLFGFRLANPIAQYYLVFIIVVLMAFAARRLMDSRTGRAWLAGSEDETAAVAFGVNTGAYRMLGLVMTSALAGLAGALYATTLGYVDPDIVSFHIATLTLTMVILGGAGSVTGAMLGVLLIIGYDKVIITQIANVLARFWPKNTFIGSVPDIRGTNFFNFGIALYLTVLIRARKKKP